MAGHADKRAGGVKAIMAAMFANLGIAIMKLIAWLFTGAASLLAEAIHSIADTTNQVLMLVGDKTAEKKADATHQFGYGRYRFLTAFLVALILFSMGGLFAIYEAFHKFEELMAGHPNELLQSQWWWVAIVVLGGAIIMECFSFRVALRESAPHRKGMSLWRFVRESKEPEFLVVILEDLAALLGLVFAFVGIGLALLTGNAIFDVAASGLIGVLLIVVAVILAIETKSLLVGESADEKTMAGIVERLEAVEQFQHVLYVKTLYLGPEELLVAAKVTVADDLDAEAVAQAIDDAEKSIREAYPVVGPIYLEPDTWKPAELEA